MERVSITAFTVLILLGVNSCRFISKGVQGSGVRKTEKRELGAFKSINAADAYQMFIKCQQAQSFEIEGDDNILPIIKTEVRDGVLHIYSEKATTRQSGSSFASVSQISIVSLHRAPKTFRSQT